MTIGRADPGVASPPSRLSVTDRPVRVKELEVSFQLPADKQFEFNDNQISPPASTTAQQACFAALGMILGMALPARRDPPPQRPPGRRDVRRFQRRQVTPAVRAVPRTGRRAAWVSGGLLALGLAVGSMLRRRSRDLSDGSQ